MAHLTVPQMINLVLSYHPHVGDDQLFNCICIAAAESGGDTLAISPSHDYGTWQINRIHFGDGIINAGNWTVQRIQVAEMFRLSAGMTNWAAWCTAWLNPGPNCGHGNLPNIQAGSAAWAQKDQVSADISRMRGTPPPGQAPPPTPPDLQAERALSREFAQIRHYCAVIAPAQYRALTGITRQLNSLTAHYRGAR
jgi:hypothetical protein